MYLYMARQHMVQERMECEECGAIFTIWRGENQRREGGHHKGLWCYRCTAKTTHVQTAVGIA